MYKSGGILLIAVIVLVNHSTGTGIHQNYKEDIYNGFDVLRKVANTILRKEHFPPLLRNKELRQAVRPICPLVERYHQVKEHISSGQAVNITELKAAKLILEYVLNDTCIWIQSLQEMENFTCSSSNLTEVESLCIEIEIKDLADEQRDLLLEIYSDEDQVYRYSLTGNKRWIEQTFSGKNTTVIESALYAIHKYSRFQNCSQTAQTVSC